MIDDPLEGRVIELGALLGPVVQVVGAVLRVAGEVPLGGSLAAVARLALPVLRRNPSAAGPRAGAGRGPVHPGTQVIPLAPVRHVTPWQVEVGAVLSLEPVSVVSEVLQVKFVSI